MYALGCNDVWSTEHKEEIVGSQSVFLSWQKQQDYAHSSDIHYSLFKTPASLKTDFYSVSGFGVRKEYPYMKPLLCSYLLKMSDKKGKQG